MFTTICPKKQQTSDNLIVEDNCFIIEIFDKCSLSGILRGCLNQLKLSLEKITVDNWYCEILYFMKIAFIFFIFARANFSDSRRTN